MSDLNTDGFSDTSDRICDPAECQSEVGPPSGKRGPAYAMSMGMFQQAINTELFVALTPDALSCPMSVEELDQLVKMNVPESQILEDLEMRPLSGALDGASERMLLRGGASLRLIRRLRCLLSGAGMP